MFDKFKDKTSTREVMKEDGIDSFYKAINIDVSTDMIFWLISMQMKAENYGEYTFAEFSNGCQANNCDTVEKWTQAAPRLRKRLENEEDYQEVYKFAGRFAVEKGKKNLEIDWAIAIQEMFLSKKCKFMDKWA